MQQLSDSDSEEEQIEILKKPEIKTDNTHRSSLSEKSNVNDNRQPIETSKKQQINDTINEKSSSIRKTNDNDDDSNDNEEQIETSGKQQANNYRKEKSPSFQSMTDQEADYKKIFKRLDPDGELEIGSRSNTPTPHSPIHESSTLRPKTRRGRQEHEEQQNSAPIVTPLIGLDELNNQTARSNDVQNQFSLPSTTTSNMENPIQRRRPNNNDDNE